MKMLLLLLVVLQKKKKMNIFTYFYYIATWLFIIEIILLGNSYICPTFITSLGRSVYTSSAVIFQELFYLWVVKLNSYVAKLYLYFSDGFQICSVWYWDMFLLHWTVKLVTHFRNLCTVQHIRFHEFYTCD